MKPSPHDETLLDWANGLLEERERLEVEAALTDSPEHAKKAAFLRAILSEAGSLPVPEPSEQLRIATLREARRARETPNPWWVRFFQHPAFSVAAVAGTCAVVAVVVLRIFDSPVSSVSPVALAPSVVDTMARGEADEASPAPPGVPAAAPAPPPEALEAVAEPSRDDPRQQRAAEELLAAEVSEEERAIDLDEPHRDAPGRPEVEVVTAVAPIPSAFPDEPSTRTGGARARRDDRDDRVDLDEAATGDGVAHSLFHTDGMVSPTPPDPMADELQDATVAAARDRAAPSNEAFGRSAASAPAERPRDSRARSTADEAPEPFAATRPAIDLAPAAPAAARGSASGSGGRSEREDARRRDAEATEPLPPDIFEDADRLAAQGRHSEAVQAYGNLRGRDRSGRACVGLGTSLAALGQSDAARDVLSACVSTAQDRRWRDRAARALDALSPVPAGAPRRKSLTLPAGR
jgi:hypothetical protein